VAQPAVQSVERALSILVVLGKQSAPMGVTALATEIGLAKSTVHRLLTTLERASFVTRTGEGRYAIAPMAPLIPSRAPRPASLSPQQVAP